MKRFAGVLMVLAVFGVGYLFGAGCRDYNAGSSAGTQGAALAQGITGAPVTEVTEPIWYDDFDARVKDQRTFNGTTKEYDKNAKAIPLCWLLKIVLRSIDQDEKNMIFVVTDPDGQVLSADKYKIYIRGYGKIGDISWAEDFPPVLYP